ncbi:bloodthirsty-related gene family, member 2 isoform X2 [Oncorhynchus tshawytscha]|uniref:Bloodthirsty-related gene family, member 2 n=1 Tax=Oncorhynchus tshawytscha TaxID=74940 RepID=A0AAZ3PJU0_ONCTS|nr:bloodthirsty-related gene family, member 2 isoform X2 [Oncorhynchus tshawytscha]
MASTISTISLVSERHFLCPLCKDIFSSPVTTPCGHSFCQECLCGYWTRHRSDYCPLCKRLFHSRPDLSVNRILADVCDNYRTTRPESPEESHNTLQVVDIDQMIQERLKKVDRLRHSLQLLKNSCVREVRESQKVFSALVSSMEKSHKAVVAAIEERQGEEERIVEKLVKELEQEILQLRNGDTDLRPCHSQQSHDELCGGGGGGGQKSVAVSTTSTTGYSERRDWSKVTMETDPCMGVTRRAVSDLMDVVKGELCRLSKAELKKIQKYTDISLSPKTAHAFLSVSEDRKQVRHTDKHQEVPDNPKRFDRVANVLGRESFSSGRYYWEVEVGEKIEWNLGVARQSINRKGKFTVSPANGFWTLSLKSGGQYVANTSPTVTPVGLEQKPRKVGVFLDYVEGRVSFYCAETGVHIHTFTDGFTDRLHPLFSPGRQHGGRNIAPLTISTSFCSI